MSRRRLCRARTDKDQANVQIARHDFPSPRLGGCCEANQCQPLKRPGRTTNEEASQRDMALPQCVRCGRAGSRNQPSARERRFHAFDSRTDEPGQRRLAIAHRRRRPGGVLPARGARHRRRPAAGGRTEVAGLCAANCAAGGPGSLWSHHRVRHAHGSAGDLPGSVCGSRSSSAVDIPTSRSCGRVAKSAARRKNAVASVHARSRTLPGGIDSNAMTSS